MDRRNLMNLNFSSKKRGQGSLEYLLIIGGAIAIAAIVIFMVLSSVPAQNPDTTRRIAIGEECTASCADPSFCRSQGNASFTSTTSCISNCRDSADTATGIKAQDC